MRAVLRRLVLLACMLAATLALRAQEPRTSRHEVRDDRNRVAVVITYSYDSNGVVETRKLQSFDTDGKLTRTELYTADEHLLYTEDIHYDRHGNRSRCLQISYDEDGVPTRTDYRYTYYRADNGLWKLKSIRLNGEVLWRSE